MTDFKFKVGDLVKIDADTSMFDQHIGLIIRIVDAESREEKQYGYENVYDDYMILVNDDFMGWFWFNELELINRSS